MISSIQTDISDASNFAIIYPNGGTKSNPATITTGKRYVEKNPFPGYYVYCYPQIYSNNQWGNPGDVIYADGGYGTGAHQLLPADSIIVRTGNAAINCGTSGAFGGAPFSKDGMLTSAPCRVLVYKFGKIT